MKNILLTLTCMVLLIGFASADVTQLNKIYYGIIEDDGSLTVTQTPISNFNVIGFTCTADDCSSIGGTLWNGNTLNSGANAEMSLTYPASLQQKGYGVYFYKNGYIPYELKADLQGTGQAPNEMIYLTRSKNCEVPVNHLIISHFGNKITVNVTLDAGVRSPLQNAGPLNYVPSSLSDLYSINSKVDFRFIGPQNVSISKNVNLPYSESREVFATTTLAAGDYRIEIESNTADDKCLNSIPNKLNTNVNIVDNRTNVTLPLIGILSPQPITYTNKTILVNLRSVNATSVIYNWNGNNITYTSPVYVEFNEGINTLTAYAINNITTAKTSVTFFVNLSANNNQTTNQTNATDTIPPSTITNLYLSSKGTNFLNWTWANPSDSDFSQSIIYLNGINVANTNNNFYSAVNLQPNTVYTITINTKDLSGNINTINVSDTQTTLSSTPVNPPRSVHHDDGQKEEAALEELPEETPIVSTPIIKKDKHSTLTPITPKSNAPNWLLWLLILLIANIILLIIILAVSYSRPNRQINNGLSSKNSGQVVHELKKK